MKNKHIQIFMLLIFSHQCMAANMSYSGEGEVLVFPYYTVNNGLNTLVKITNNRNEAKAIKVNFLEGDNMALTLSYNVYLDAYDSWDLGLVATTSTISGFIGQPSVLQVSSDTSCSPFLNKSGQEFLPFAFLTFPSTGNENMERVTQGMIQVFEMGVLPEDVAAWVEHDHVGVPANCSGIERGWTDNGNWDLTDLMPATGGLSGSATVVNVSEGASVTYKADAIENFYHPDEVIHTEPGSFLPDLSSAMPKSVVFNDGQIYESNWSTGEDAISALYMSTSISNDFLLGSFIAAKTEWVVSFPTKGFYVNDVAPKAPFQSVYDDEVGACLNFGRHSEVATSFGGGFGAAINNDPVGHICTRPPTPDTTAFCWASNVLFFYNCQQGNEKEGGSQILGAYNNQYGIRVKPYEKGHSVIDFSRTRDFDSNALTDIDDKHAYFGFPVTGFSINKFTNANAQPGLLAQYSNINKHSYSKEITDNQ